MRVNEKALSSWSLSQALIVGAAGAIGFIATLVGLTYFPPTYSLPRHEYQAMNVIILCVATVIVGYFGVRFLKRRSADSFWETIRWNRSDLQCAAFVGIGLSFSLLFRYAMTRHLAIKVASLSNDRLFILVFVGAVVLQPIIEEVYFRGILFAALENRFTSLISLIIVTLTFASLHPGHQWIVLPISVLLGITRITTRSTANCFALHAAYNLGVTLWGIR